MRLLYTALFYCLLPLILLRLLWRARKAPTYARRWGERFGFFTAPESFSGSSSEGLSSEQRTLWLHAVSVGETLAAIPLIERLLQQDFRLVVTTMTPTGSEQVRKKFGDRVFHVYAPYDLPGAIQRFIKKIQPSALVIMETELWPNTIHYCAKHRVPTILANGRLSEKSAHGYSKVRWLIGNIFRELTEAVVQYQDDGQRMIGLGLPENRVTVSGSIKFDLTLSDATRDQAMQLRNEFKSQQRLVFIAASTHKGEDEIVLQAFQTVKKMRANLLLLLVPRHPERFNDVASICENKGLTVQRRSKNEPLKNNTDVLLGDTMGELLALYGAADIVFVGGSFVEVGGHNLIEPAAWQLPILSGPHLFNFAEASRLLREANGLQVVNDATALAEQVQRLAEDNLIRNTMGQAAYSVAEENRGALNRLLQVINKRLS